MALWQKTISAVVLAGAMPAFAGVCGNSIDVAASVCADAPDAITACKTALDEDPRDLKARFSLCDELVREQRTDEASNILRSGLNTNRDSYSRSLIRAGLSNIEEHLLATPPPATPETLVQYMLIKCRELGSLEDCDNIIRARPNSADAHVGRGDILLQADRVIESIEAYQTALSLDPEQQDGTDGLNKAEAARQQLVDTCFQRPRQSTLATCRAAILPGRNDEQRLLRRVANLEMLRGDFTQALRTLGNALAIGPDQQISNEKSAIETALRCISEARDNDRSECAKVRPLLASMDSATSLVSELDSILSDQEGQIESSTPDLIAHCQNLAQSADFRTALQVCRDARQEEQLDGQAKIELERTLAALEFKILEDECISAADSRGALAAQYECDAALDAAPSGYAGPVIALTASRQRLRDFESCRMAFYQEPAQTALNVCESVASQDLDENNEAELERILATLRSNALVASYGNHALSDIPGIEYVTF